MSEYKRLLEFELSFDEEKDYQKERLVVEEFDAENLSVFSERYMTYDWKPHGWYASFDEGVMIRKESLPALIKCLEKFMNNKT